MITVNCDIGERGAYHPVDIELMNYINIANIACGGHAGDAESVAAFKKIAADRGVKASAHLSYPDRENFGRVTVQMDMAELLRSLEEQLDLLGGADSVKFHGALYNDSVIDSGLASQLALWLKRMNIKEIIAPADSELAAFCIDEGIKIIAEAFAERRYDYDSLSGRLTLVSRKEPHASITLLQDALDHALGIIKNGTVNPYIEGKPQLLEVPIKCDTICIHSDSEIALDLAKGLHDIISSLSAKG